MVVLFVIFILVFTAFIFSMWSLYKMCEWMYYSFLISSLWFMSGIVSWMIIPALLMFTHDLIN